MSSSLDEGLDYAKTHPLSAIAFEVKCDIGKCKTLVAGDPIMKSWYA